jgi:hypothetical protein
VRTPRDGICTPLSKRVKSKPGKEAMAQNILEKIEELCRHKQYEEVRDLASRNVSVLTQVLHEYIKQNSSDTTDPERQRRLKGAKNMLEHGGQ